jgi:cyclase
MVRPFSLFDARAISRIKLTDASECLSVATHNRWWRVVVAVLGISGSVYLASAQQNDQSGETLDVLQVRPNFYMIAGAGGNIAIQIGSDGVVVVDSGSAEMTDTVLGAIKKLSSRPIRYIINTSADADHVGGNAKMAAAGQSFFKPGGIAPGDTSVSTAINNGGGASIVATENVFTRMSEPSGTQAPYPTIGWPTESFGRKQKVLYLNDEGIQILAQPTAHTDGDSFVLFRRSDVVVTGDIFDIDRFPVIALEQGGSIQGEIDALNRLMEVTIPVLPMPWRPGGTLLVPGHGRICEQAELVEYRDMVTIIRDRIQAMIKRGKTLEQVKAADPAQGYARRYGAESGRSTTNMFVEALYKSLTEKH